MRSTMTPAACVRAVLRASGAAVAAQM